LPNDGSCAMAYILFAILLNLADRQAGKPAV
jgi:hypothetical protein